MRISLGTFGFAATAIVLYALAVMWRASSEDPVKHAPLISNPIYLEQEAVAKPLGLDVSFARFVRTGRFDARDNLLFSDAPKEGWDVIILGDSALAWSFSSRLAEQASGKRVAFLAQTNAFANKGMLALSQKVADRYLKPGGQLVYLFSSGSWEQEPSKPQLTADMQWLTAWASPSGSAYSARNIARKMNEFSLWINKALGLPDIPFYTQYIEPRVAPLRADAKKAAAFGAGCVEFQWQDRGGSVFYMCDPSKNPTPNAARAKRATLMTGAEQCTTNPNALPTIRAMEANIRELKNVTVRNKIIAIPFAIDQSAMWLFRCVSQDTLNEANARILDLPKESQRLFGDIEYEFEGGPHVANASSVRTSYVLGKSLSH